MYNAKTRSKRVRNCRKLKLQPTKIHSTYALRKFGECQIILLKFQELLKLEVIEKFMIYSISFKISKITTEGGRERIKL